MERIQKSLVAAALASEVSHVFCCVLPIVFSFASLLASLGVVGVTPVFLIYLHEVMHDWEIPMIITSFVVLALGWGLYFYSRKIDCHDTGCGHGSCEPRKNRAHTILKITTILFLINVSVYAVLHVPEDARNGATVIINDDNSRLRHDHE